MCSRRDCCHSNRFSYCLATFCVSKHAPYSQKRITFVRILNWLVLVQRVVAETTTLKWEQDEFVQVFLIGTQRPKGNGNSYQVTPFQMNVIVNGNGRFKIIRSGRNSGNIRFLKRTGGSLSRSLQKLNIVILKQYTLNAETKPSILAVVISKIVP